MIERLFQQGRVQLERRHHFQGLTIFVDKTQSPHQKLGNVQPVGIQAGEGILNTPFDLFLIQGSSSFLIMSIPV